MSTSTRDEPFAGDKKDGMSVLGPYEKTLIAYLAPKVPEWINTALLTYTTLLWSGLVVLCCYLAATVDITWLIGASIAIFMQWLTDCLDGAVGRLRDTGLVKWGYYMDHFLDFVFLCSIMYGYTIMLPTEQQYLGFWVQTLCSMIMVNSFLGFATTNRFKIAWFGIGPTEIRIGFILVNIFLMIFGLSALSLAMPWAVALGIIVTLAVVWRNGRMIWRLDEAEKGTKILRK